MATQGRQQLACQIMVVIILVEQQMILPLLFFEIIARSVPLILRVVLPVPSLPLLLALFVAQRPLVLFQLVHLPFPPLFHLSLMRNRNSNGYSIRSQVLIHDLSWLLQYPPLSPPLILLLLLLLLDLWVVYNLQLDLWALSLYRRLLLRFPLLYYRLLSFLLSPLALVPLRRRR